MHGFQLHLTNFLGRAFTRRFYKLSDLFVGEAFFVVGCIGEALVNHVELLWIEFGKAELLDTFFEGVTPAVFSEDQFALGDPDALGVDDFVSALVLEVAILMDARFVGEGIGTDDGFVS